MSGPRQMEIVVAAGMVAARDGEKRPKKVPPLELTAYLEANPTNILLPARGHVRTVEMRAASLRHILEQIFIGAERVVIVPLRAVNGVQHAMATWSGRGEAGASMLLLGKAENLLRRTLEYSELAHYLKDLGEHRTLEQLIGLESVKQDGMGVWAGAAASMHGGLWTIPEFAHCSLALTVTPLSVLYATMLQGDPKNAVQHHSLAANSLSTVAKRTHAGFEVRDIDHLASLCFRLMSPLSLLCVEILPQNSKPPTRRSSSLSTWRSSANWSPSASDATTMSSQSFTARTSRAF